MRDDDDSSEKESSDTDGSLFETDPFPCEEGEDEEEPSREMFLDDSDVIERVRKEAEQKPKTTWPPPRADLERIEAATVTEATMPAAVHPAEIPPPEWAWPPPPKPWPPPPSKLEEGAASPAEDDGPTDSDRTGVDLDGPPGPDSERPPGPEAPPSDR